MFLIKQLMEAPVINDNQFNQLESILLKSNALALKEIDDYLLIQHASAEKAIKLKARYIQGRMAAFRNNFALAIDCFEEGISENDTFAMTCLAFLYQQGKGMPDNLPNYSAAIALYDRAIEGGNTLAMSNRALMYQKGKGEPGNLPNYPAAIALYDRAIERGNADAMSHRAWMYLEGKGTPGNLPNYPAAIALFDRAIESGDIIAMLRRALMYKDGEGEPSNLPNYPAAIALFNRAIKSGNTLAMSHRALMYQAGNGEPGKLPNYPAAIALYDRAIERGDDSAISNRAWMYKNGKGEPGNLPNYPAAIALYDRAIKRGDDRAMSHRALMYQAGNGEPGNLPNYPAAIALLDRAIESGNIIAMSHRAWMYLEGKGTPGNLPNYPAAIALFDRTIESGNINDMLRRALMYQAGNGEPGNLPNYPAAIALYDRAIERGDDNAMCLRALMYQVGNGEPDNLPNYPAAIALYDRAIKRGNASAMGSRAGMYEYGLGGNIDYLAAFLLYSHAAELDAEPGSKPAKNMRSKVITDHPEIVHSLLDHYLLQLDDRTQFKPDFMLKKALDFALSNCTPSDSQAIKIQVIKAHNTLVDNDIKSALTLLKNCFIESLTETSLFLFVSIIIGGFGLRADLLEDPEKSLFKATCLKLALDYLDVAVINYPKSSELNALHRHTELQYLTKSKLLANVAESETEIIERQNRAKSRRATSHIADLLKFLDTKQKQINNSWVPLLISGLDKILAPTRELIENLSAGHSLYSLVNSHPEIKKHPELYHLCLELLSPSREAFKDLIAVYNLTAGQALIIEETSAIAGAGVGMVSAHPSVHPEITTFFTRINADREITIGISESASAGK
ncbi:MAG: tetratricopeptide repeat protein [Gammaproteobacteria bacterium]|nr:tetratricopeptide repeat protein [Gammaproteobacteria bacterium]